jgi:hypothetical protein
MCLYQSCFFFGVLTSLVWDATFILIFLYFPQRPLFLFNTEPFKRKQQKIASRFSNCSICIKTNTPRLSLSLWLEHSSQRRLSQDTWEIKASVSLVNYGVALLETPSHQSMAPNYAQR